MLQKDKILLILSVVLFLILLVGSTVFLVAYQQSLFRSQIAKADFSSQATQSIDLVDPTDTRHTLKDIQSGDSQTQSNTNNTEISNTWKLPFGSGKTVLIEQGYMGKFSHQDKYALDFQLDKHINIVAARDGKIKEVYSGGKWDGWCYSWDDCNKKGDIWRGNHIIIDHGDGTFAKYLHLNPGSLPKNLTVGSIVKHGDYLGQMGSIGYTCLDTPKCTIPDNHLHFEVFQYNHGEEKTLPTPFFECNNPANQCDKNGWLIEDKYYTKNLL